MWRIFTLILCLGRLAQLQAFDTCHYKLRADFVAADACPGQDIGLTNISMCNSHHIRCQWFLGDGRYTEEYNPVVSYPKGGVYRKITLKVFDSVSKCRDSIQKMLEVFPKPESDFRSVCKTADSFKFRQFTAYRTNPIDHSFLWYLPNGDSLYITGKNYLLVPDTLTVVNDRITLKVRSDLGCVSVTSREYNLVSLNQQFKPEVKLYSTPGSLTINCDAILEYDLFNAQGQWLQSGQISEDSNRITDLQSGIYYIQLRSDNKGQSTFKVIVY